MNPVNAVLVALLLAAEPARFTTVCDCVQNGRPCAGIYRWAVKTETNHVADCQPITPSEIASWPDQPPDAQTGSYRKDAPRCALEDICFELTGRVVLVRAEPDGDLHVQLRDVEGINPVNVVVEIPAGYPWCLARSLVFFLTKEQPPFSTPKNLTLLTNAVITVTGKAFYDGTHAGGTHLPNRRNYDAGTSIWELHPVMSVTIH